MSSCSFFSLIFLYCYRICGLEVSICVLRLHLLQFIEVLYFGWEQSLLLYIEAISKYFDLYFDLFVMLNIIMLKFMAFVTFHPQMVHA